MPPPSQFEAILLAELNIGLPPTSFWRLLREPDDWSFILKLHAIFEGVLARVIEKRVADKTVDEYTSFTRRVQLAFELPCLSGNKGEGERYRSFLLDLNSLRNRFAHNASYICADLRTVLLSIPLRRQRDMLRNLNLTLAFNKPNLLLDRLSPVLLKAQPDPEKTKKLRDVCAKVFPRIMLMTAAADALDLLSLARFIELGKDGKHYAEEFRPQLQDLLNDPAVIEFRRQHEIDMQNYGFGEDKDK
jgi:hypothetical protein